MSCSPFRPLFVALEIIRIRKLLTLSMLSVDKMRTAPNGISKGSILVKDRQRMSYSPFVPYLWP